MIVKVCKGDGICGMMFTDAFILLNKGVKNNDNDIRGQSSADKNITAVLSVILLIISQGKMVSCFLSKEDDLLYKSSTSKKS
jgi:hypothetical protein